MSQAGEIDVIGTHPEIPTLFIADVGSAVPIANTLEILGQLVAAGTHPIRTTGSGNTITTQAQISQAIASTNINNVGLAAFDSSKFTVDANGFVSLVGGSVTESFEVQANTAPGTNPVVPTVGGIVNVNGAAVANHSVVLETRSRAANTYNVEVQYATTAASTTANLSGVAHFDSSIFTVDASGFVSLVGAAAAIEKINLQTGTTPIVPSSGAITLNGEVVASGINPIRTNGTGANTATVQVQITQALAATDATKIGLSNFDSAAFDVDSNGFVQLNGGGIATTSFDVQANTAPGTDPVVPTASGVVTVNGAAVANHSVVLETRSRAANAYNLEIQYATSAAATDSTKSGVAHFNSSQFSVDSSGFVALLGGGEAIDSIAVQTGTSPIAPTAAGLVTINGAVVAAGTNPIRTDGTGANTMAVEVQISQAIASTDATKIGLSNFDSARFTVDANGFVSINGSGLGETITGQSGGALSPTAGNWNISGASTAAGTSPVVTSGSGSTLTVNVQKSQAIASTDATKIGLAAFDSADFSVDANGFVTATSTTMNYTNVNHAASPYTVLADDKYISVDCSGGVVTLNFPNAPTFKRTWIIKDRTGSAATSNITITTPGGTVTFDGLTSYVMNSNYQAINILANSTPTYEVY